MPTFFLTMHHSQKGLQRSKDKLYTKQAVGQMHPAGREDLDTGPASMGGAWLRPSPPRTTFQHRAKPTLREIPL